MKTTVSIPFLRIIGYISFKAYRVGSLDIIIKLAIEDNFKYIYFWQIIYYNYSYLTRVASHYNTFVTNMLVNNKISLGNHSRPIPSRAEPAPRQLDKHVYIIGKLLPNAEQTIVFIIQKHVTRGN